MAGGTIRDGVLRLDGDLNFATAAACFRNSAEWFGVAGRVTAVDLRDVGAVDSAGLALLLEWQSAARQRGAGLEFRNAPRDLLRLAALSEATELLGLMPVPEFAHDTLG